MKSQILVIMYIFKYFSNETLTKQIKNIRDNLFFSSSKIRLYYLNLHIHNIMTKKRYCVNLITKHCKQIQNISNLRLIMVFWCDLLRNVICFNFPARLSFIFVYEIHIRLEQHYSIYIELQFYMYLQFNKCLN